MRTILHFWKIIIIRQLRRAIFEDFKFGIVFQHARCVEENANVVMNAGRQARSSKIVACTKASGLSLAMTSPPQKCK